MAEIRPVLYSRELQKLIFPDNSFYKKSVTEKGVADNVESVEKPVQGKIRKAKDGEPDSFPLKIQKADDSKKSYAVNKVYCEPLLITEQSELMANYSKRQTKQEQQAAEINTKCANMAATTWGPTKSDNLILTTGTARATNVVGLTGTRKRAVKEDMLKAHNLMLRMGVVGGQWYMLATPDMYTDLLAIDNFVSFEKTGNTEALRQGIVGRIYGMDIYYRSTEDIHAGLVYSAEKAKKGYNAELAATDQVASLIWNDKLVCHAEGVLNTSVNVGAPGYLGGTIIESWVRFGADILREDQRGVIALLEAKV